MFADGAWAEVDLYARAALRPGHAVDGPAIIAEDLATTVVEPGWQAVVTAPRRPPAVAAYQPGPRGPASAPPPTR